MEQAIIIGGLLALRPRPNGTAWGMCWPNRHQHPVAAGGLVGSIVGWTKRDEQKLA